MIAMLFNDSVEAGKFPECLKTGRVIPLFKKGNRLLVENYRPITTLLLLSKIFENLVHSRLNSFLAKYNVLTDRQFRFRTGLSTTDAILEYLGCLLYTSPSPRDKRQSRMPSSA